MRRNIVVLFAVVAFFPGCAYEGAVVEKRSRPIPFPDSLGLDAMYNFQLRDSAGQIHSQMVTADAFASYQVGDYFNDLQPPPERGDKELEGIQPAPEEMNEGPYQPVRVMQIHSPAKVVAKVAVYSNHHHPSTVNVAARSNHSIKSAAKVSVHTIRLANRTANVAAHANYRIKSAARVPVHTIRSANRTANIAAHANYRIKSSVRVPVHSTKSTAKLAASSNHSTKGAPKVAHHSNQATKSTAIAAIYAKDSIKSAGRASVHANHTIKSATKIPVHSNHHIQTVAKIAKSRHLNEQASRSADHKKKKPKVASAHHRKTVASLN